jgi:hypothetical protein
MTTEQPIKPAPPGARPHADPTAVRTAWPGEEAWEFEPHHCQVEGDGIQPRRPENPLDGFSGTRIFRTCGVEGIPLAVVIRSRYARSRGWVVGQFRIAHDDGRNGTTGWGEGKRPIRDLDRVPFTGNEFRRLMGLDDA